MILSRESGHGILRDDSRDMRRLVGSVRTEPVRRPIEGAEERARGDDRIGRPQRTGANAVRDERAHAALVPVAFGDNERAKTAGKRVHLEVRRGALDFVDEVQHVRCGERLKPRRDRLAAAAGGSECSEQPVQGPILAEIEQFVLAAEVVIEVSGREVGRDRNVPHAGRRESALPEGPRCGPQDLDATRVSAS